MRSFLFCCLMTLILLPLQAQKSYGDLYHPEADALAEIDGVIQKAAAENKHVLLQVGGNWCVWCYRLHDFIEKDQEIKDFIEANFVAYRVNYSRENMNLPVLEKYGYPQRFGFPVLIVLNAKGERLHTQDTGLLESGDRYDQRKVLQFFQQWSPAALDPSNYVK